VRVLKPIVAEASPTLYQAATRANLTGKEQNQVEQMSWAVKKNRELTQMSSADARKEFEALDPNAKEGLKSFFGEAEYMQQPPDFGDRALGALKFTGKLLASPLIGLFKVAGAYNRVINEPYKVARQVAQGESIFDYRVWHDAWDGKDLYDNKAIAEAENTFGKAKIYVAKGLLEGKKPGEILESYGDLTPEITAAVEEAFNNPDAFKQVMDAAKYAQFSPGRDIARIFDRKPPKNGGLTGDYIDGTTKNVSGVIDFIYQLAIDPLTWITGGTSKAATRGTQLAELVTKAGDDVAAGVSQVFKDKGVIKLWDEQFGPEIERLASTRNEAEKAIVRREIGRRFPGYNNDEALDFFAKKKMFNAEKAEDVFSQAENVHLLLSGRLDGMTYRRNGVVTARAERRLTRGLESFLEATFDKAFVKADNFFNVKRGAEELQAKGSDAWDILATAGRKSDEAVNPQIVEFTKQEKDIKGFRNKVDAFGKWAGKMAARNPAGQAVLTGDDAIKTIETVRNYARLVLDRDMADFVAQKFLASTEDEQIVVMRNLYAAIMQRAGITDEAIMKEYLKKTHNGRAGFTTTVRTEVDDQFAGLLSKNTVKYENDTALLEGSGAIQPSQIARGVGPLPLEEIALKANELKSKQSLIKAAQGATKSKFAKDFTDFWSVFTLFPRLGIRSAIDEGFMYALTAPGRDLLNFAKGQGRKTGRASAAYTGSSAAEGPVGSVLRKLFGKGPSSEYLGIDERNKIIEQLAEQAGVSPAEVQHLVINQAIADRVKIFLPEKLGDEAMQHWNEAMIYNPDVLNTMASSVAARSSLGSSFDEVIRNNQINLSELSNALNAVGRKMARKKYEGKNLSEKEIDELVKNEGLKSGTKYEEYAVEKLRDANPEYVTLAHYDNWYIRFATPRQHGRGLKIADDYRVAPAIAFFNHGALKTPENFSKAMDDMYTYLGMKKTGFNVGTKSISGGNAGKGTPLGDAKDVAMRNDADAAIVELENIVRQKEIVSANPNAVGKTSTETSLLQLGPATGDLTGKTIMLARNGKLANQPLREETIAQIKSAKEAGAKFIVGDMPGVDTLYYKVLDEIEADYIVYHTGTSPRVKVNTKSFEGKWEITEQNIDAVKKFNSFFGDSVFMRQEGKTDFDIARVHLERMLMDMRDNFHGGPKGYNEGLYDAIKSNYNALVAKEKAQQAEGMRKWKIGSKWQKAAQMIDFKQFDELTKGYQPSGLIQTRIEFPDLTTFDSAFKRLGNTMMEAMDKQVNGLLRQPAVMTTYLRLRKEYSGIQAAYARELRAKMIAENPTKWKGDKAQIRLNNLVEEQSAKHFTEIALNDAADTVLKFADNPSIRSNFAVEVRTVGRFYRATEDFWRRVYRLKDVSPTVLYRMRLAHLGLSSSGMFHEDQNGQPYIMMPMDNIIFKATDTSIKALTGESQYKQPMFNDFTFKLSNVNPSFSPDSGLPLLSGPIAALSVIGMKNLVSQVPIPGAEKAAQDFDNFALGNLGDNVDVVRALIPGSLLKLWNILPLNEKSRQEVTAAQQAVAYNAAHGLSLQPTASDQEKYEYLNAIRTSAHNVIALRSILGLISPVTASLQESKDVPDYLLDVGITGLRNEFWDIYEAVNKKYGSDVQDPYELSLSIFTGQYPGKIVYTVARDEKQTKVLISKTTQMRNWAIENKKLIGAYGEAAYIFGPHTGDFNAGIYNWLQAADLLKDKDLETYFRDVQVAEDKQAYYDIASWEKNSLASQTYISERKRIIETATQARKGLLASNPLLLGAITGGGNEIATEESMLNSLKQMVSDPTTNINDGVRLKMKTAVQAMEDFMSFAKSDQVRSLYNASSLKRDYRARVENIINQLASEDPAVKEAARAIFNSILKYYSRDTYRAAV